MESTPSSSLPKRTRAKPKTVVKDPVETQSAAVKKPRAPRKTLTTTATPAEPRTIAETQVLPETLDAMPEDVGTMVATAAYYLAAARNFSPGHELDDWLEAERAIHARLFG